VKRNTKRTKKTQACVGCGDPFTTFKNYDYCVDCAINGNRYLVKSNCSECDGSGWIKFKHQPKRPCKLCYLTKTPMKNQLTKEERYWDQVDQLAQEKIYQLFTTNIPFQNIKLITESWRPSSKTNWSFSQSRCWLSHFTKWYSKPVCWTKFTW